MDLRGSQRKEQALTLVDVLVTIGILAIIVAMLLPALVAAKKKSSRLNCNNNLKELCLGFKIWSQDENDQFPAQIPKEKGGTLATDENEIAVWTFQAISNEISRPKLLLCPIDHFHVAATNFSDAFGSQNISYFAGISAALDHPRTFLVGDDNFLINGFSVKAGLLALSTNLTANLDKKVIDWDEKRHPDATGNIGFADCSVEETYFYSLRDRLSETGLATNRLAIP